MTLVSANVRDYGAGVGDSTAGIQAALAATGWPERPGHLTIPPGDYHIGAGIVVDGGGATWTPPLTIAGQGARLITTREDATILAVTNSAVSLTRVTVSDVYFQHNAKRSVGIALHNAELFRAIGCGFGASFGTGVRITGNSPYATFHACEFGNAGRGIEINGDAAFLSVTGCQFIEQLVGDPLNWIHQHDGNGAKRFTLRGASITGNVFYGDGATLPAIDLGQAVGCTITGNAFDLCRAGAVRLGIGGGASRGNVVTGNTAMRCGPEPWHDESGSLIDRNATV